MMPACVVWEKTVCLARILCMPRSIEVAEMGIKPAGEYVTHQQARVRMVDFLKDHEDDYCGKGRPQEFYRDLFGVFGIRQRDYKAFGPATSRAKRMFRQKYGDGGSTRSIEVLVPGLLLVRQRTKECSLDDARERAFDYLKVLPDKDRPKYVLVSDFDEFWLFDLDNDTVSGFTLGDLPNNIERLWFLTGRDPNDDMADAELTVKALHVVGDICRKLKGQNYTDVDVLITRLVFCMFANNTGVFPDRVFSSWLRNTSHESLGTGLAGLFEVLDTPEQDRQKIDNMVNMFPCVNGGLFGERIAIPLFDAETAEMLCKANDLDWKSVSPAIFGSLFQSMMKSDERRHHGAHYTEEDNILRVLKPLFLDRLYDEFKRITDDMTKSRRRRLEVFQDKLSGLQFLDPACGSGNFLIIAYREIRLLELSVLKELYGATCALDATMLSKVNADQFYGIELNPSSCKMAEMGMWMMDHIMNLKLSERFGAVFSRMPLTTGACIRNGNALMLDWNDVLPSERCSYILGNPPYRGSRLMDEQQKADLRHATGGMDGYRNLDYVSGWFVKAADYMPETAKLGFVATNSITQGLPVSIMWPRIFDHNLGIIFAHDTFRWESADTGKAHVYVVIIGLGQESGQKRLFLSGAEINPEYITPYLRPASDHVSAHAVVSKSTDPITRRPEMKLGSQPIDGSHYQFSDAERGEFVRAEPASANLFRPFIGAVEMIQGKGSHILYLADAEPNMLQGMPLVRKRIECVVAHRQKSKRPETRDLAQTPRNLGHTNIPEGDFLMIPETSSEKRDYIPCAFFSNPVIPKNSAKVVENATLGLFGLLSSSMHMVWLHYFGGRLKSDYRYSIHVVYNTFPFPEKPLDALDGLARSVLDARASHPASTLASLYDNSLMPADVCEAHARLDKAVDRLYRQSPFGDNGERLDHLMWLYTELVS